MLEAVNIEQPYSCQAVRLLAHLGCHVKDHHVNLNYMVESFKRR